MQGLVVIGIMMLIAGFVLVGVEMVIPGFGAPGIIGSICLVGGIFLSSDSFEQGVTITAVVAILLAVMFAVVLALFHMKKIKPPIILEAEVCGEKGILNTSDLEYLVGKKGTASTDLRPAGKCNIEGVEFDVRSDGRYIAKGSKVRIVRVQGNTLIIKEVGEGE